MREVINLYSYHLSDLIGSIDGSYDLLSNNEKQRAFRYVRQEDRDRYILGRGMLRRILARSVGTDPRTLIVEQDAKGKPFLKGTSRQFSLSHSHERLLIALADNRRVGVDIEYCRSRPDVISLSRRWFTSNESAYIEKAESQLFAFYDVWTKKESYFKARGTGIDKDIGTFDVPIGEVLGDASTCSSGNWFFQRVFIDSQYCSAIVSETPIVAVELISDRVS